MVAWLAALYAAFVSEEAFARCPSLPERSFRLDKLCSDS